MAIEVKKIQTAEQTTPTPRTDAGQSAVNSSSSEPIKLEIKTEKQQNEVTKYINSPEFKELSKEEQLKQLKEKFPYLAGASNEQLKAYITTINNENTDKTETTTEAQTTENSIDTTGSVNKSKLETLAEDYIKKTKFKGDIDKLNAALLSKQKAGEELTDDEKKILALFNNKTEKSDKYMLPVTKLMSKQFQKLPPKQQAAEAAKAYLSQYDKTYQNLPDEQKEEYLANKVNDIFQMVTGKEKLTSAEEKKAVMTSLSLIQTAADNNISIEDLKNMSAEDRAAAVRKTQNNVIKEIINLVDKETLDKASYKETVNLYADALLSVLDENYRTTTDAAQKEKLRNEAIAKFVGQLAANDSGANIDSDTKFTLEHWNNMSTEEQQAMLERVAVTVTTIIKNTPEDGDILGALQDIKNQPDLTITQSNIAAIKKRPKTEENKKLLAQLEAEAVVLERLSGQGVDKPSKEQFYNEILKMEKEGIELSPELQAKKTELKKYMQLYEQGRKEHSIERSNEEAARLRGIDTDKYVEQQINAISKAPKKMGRILARELLRGAKDLDDFKRIKQQMQQQGVAPEVIAEASKVIEERVTAKAFSKADNAKQFNKTVTASMKSPAAAKIAQKATYHAPEWFEAKEDVAQIAAVSAQYKELQEPLTQGLHKFRTREDNVFIISSVSSSGQVSDAAMATFSETFIKTANNDTDRVYYANSMTNIDNPAVTEGLAAASKYVTSPEAKSQYISYVEAAARNYPPEQQTAIRTAIQTGEISQATLARTTPSVITENTNPNSIGQNSSAPQTNAQAQQSNTTSAAQTGQKAATTGQQNISGQQTAKTLTQTQSNIVSQRYTPAASTETSTTASKISSTADNQAAKTSAVSGTSSNNITNEETMNQTTVKAQEAQKEAALNNIAEVKENIDKSIAQWEAEHNTKLTDEEKEILQASAAIETMEEYLETSENTPSEKEAIRQSLYNASSISEVYDILVSVLGSKVYDKFIEGLAVKGSSDLIRSFVESKAGNKDIVKDLYLRCTSSTLKSELLSLLPSDTIAELLQSKQIDNLNDIDYKILKNYIQKNIYSMSNSEFTFYLQYLPLDEREKLVEQRNSSMGSKPANNEATHLTGTVKPDPAAQAPEIAPARITQAKQPANNQAQVDKKQKQESKTETPQRIFAQGETTKTLADGTVITKQGTSFGAISNNAYDDDYRIVGQQEGAPIGMNDQVLTPGSEEWKRKYNKQQTPPVTAFTMAALEEEELGMPFGSTKVGMGQKIKKKYPPQGFRFNA